MVRQSYLTLMPINSSASAPGPVVEEMAYFTIRAREQVGKIGVGHSSPARRETHPPVPAGGVGVDGDGVAGGHAECLNRQVGDADVEAPQPRANRTSRLPGGQRFGQRQLQF